MRQSAGSLAALVCGGALILAGHAAGPTFAAGGTAEEQASQSGLIPVTTPQGAIIWAELADTTEKRVRGLMFRTSLPKDRGMLFTFPDAQHWTMWMQNTWIPLDIVWLDQRKRIVHIEANVPACHRSDNGCPQYQPNKKAAFVLELAAGSSAELGLHAGARLSFPVDAPEYLLR